MMMFVFQVRDFADVFSGATSFNGDISNWDMASAQRLDNLFKDAELFNGDLSKWFVQPTSMDSTFHGASSFTGRRGLRSWDTSQVNDMHRVFTNSKFQGDISSWNMTFVTTVRQMFLGCESFDGDLSKWDVSNVSFSLGKKCTIVVNNKEKETRYKSSTSSHFCHCDSNSSTFPSPPSISQYRFGTFRPCSKVPMPFRRIFPNGMLNLEPNSIACLPPLTVSTRICPCGT